MNDISRPPFQVRQVPPPAEEDPLFIHAISRGFQVLSAFHGATKPLTLNDISTRSGLGKSAVQRVVHTLRQQGYLERDADDRGYVPGLRVLDHTLDYLRLNADISRILPILMELRRETGERVDFSLRDDLRLVYALRLQSKREFYFSALIGNSIPLYCTAGGRAVLSRLPDGEVRDVLERSTLTRYSLRTISEPSEILEKVAEARASGFALAVEEVVQGEIALGVAIMGPAGSPIGAIHIAGSLSEWDAESFSSKFAPLAMAAAGSLNAR